MGRKSSWGDVFRVWSVYVGVVVGAGFASGREIVTYFVIYGERWWAGMALAGLLFALVGWAVLRLIRQGPRTYRELMRQTLGRRLGTAMEWVSGLFLLALFCTMCAAAGELLRELTGWPRWAGAVGLLLVCLLVFVRGVAGVVALNAVLAPMLLVGGFLLALLLGGGAVRPAFSAGAGLWRFSRTWVFSALLYVSYNLITAVSVLLPLAPYLRDSRTPRRAGLLGGLAMALLGTGLGLALSRHPEAGGAQLPLWTLLRGSPGVWRGLYLFFLLAAIATTAVGNGFGGLRFLEERFPRLRGRGLWLLAGAALAASLLDFSRWVALVYPLFGYVGLLELAVLLASFTKS